MKRAPFFPMTLSTWATLTMATFHHEVPGDGPKMPPSLRTAAWCWCHLLAAQHWSMMQGTGGSGGFFGWLVYNSYTRSVKDSNRLEPRAPQKTKESCRKLLGTARASWSHQLAKHFSEGLVNLLAPVAAFTQMYVWAFFLQTALWCFWYHRLGLFSVAPNVMDLHERFKFQILRYPALFYSFPGGMRLDNLTGHGTLDCEAIIFRMVLHLYFQHLRVQLWDRWVRLANGSLENRPWVLVSEENWSPIQQLIHDLNIWEQLSYKNHFWKWQSLFSPMCINLLLSGWCDVCLVYQGTVPFTSFPPAIWCWTSAQSRDWSGAACCMVCLNDMKRCDVDVWDHMVKLVW